MQPGPNSFDAGLADVVNNLKPRSHTWLKLFTLRTRERILCQTQAKDGYPLGPVTWQGLSLATPGGWKGCDTTD